MCLLILEILAMFFILQTTFSKEILVISSEVLMNWHLDVNEIPYLTLNTHPVALWPLPGEVRLYEGPVISRDTAQTWSPDQKPCDGFGFCSVSPCNVRLQTSSESQQPVLKRKVKLFISMSAESFKCYIHRQCSNHKTRSLLPVSSVPELGRQTGQPG